MWSAWSLGEAADALLAADGGEHGAVGVVADRHGHPRSRRPVTASPMNLSMVATLCRDLLDHARQVTAQHLGERVGSLLLRVAGELADVGKEDGQLLVRPPQRGLDTGGTMVDTTLTGT